jgi:hypothetical protein
MTVTAIPCQTGWNDARSSVARVRLLYSAAAASARPDRPQKRDIPPSNRLAFANFYERLAITNLRVFHRNFELVRKPGFRARCHLIEGAAQNRHVGLPLQGTYHAKFA